MTLRLQHNIQVWNDHLQVQLQQFYKLTKKNATRTFYTINENIQIETLFVHVF